MFYLYIDDKKLSGVLKKMALTNINGVEEVNIFKNDGSVIHISAPKSKLNDSKIYIVYFKMYILLNNSSSFDSFQHLRGKWIIGSKETRGITSRHS